MLRSLREGIGTSNAAGRIVAVALASLAGLVLELAKNVALRRGVRAGRAGSPSVAQRRSVTRRLGWLAACTKAVKRRPQSRRRLASAVPRSTECSAALSGSEPAR